MRPSLSMVCASIWALRKTPMPQAASFSATSSFTTCVIAWGLMNRNAVFLGACSTLMARARSRQVPTSRSSSASKTPRFLPSTSTSQSPNQASSVSCRRPLSSRACPKGSWATCKPSQLTLSASPSKGLAEACSPLSPVSGQLLSPSSSQRWRIALRIEDFSASAGFVAPTTFARKSAQESLAGSKSTSKYWMHAGGVVYFARIAV
mmetsp:Transcript_48503/g.128101  ORF Transcript_48503/g.128101 Transcript_48503/m.128101 type:complete len:206 (-) Transcript_48503:198-815(-)